jgi:omega-6 fatty acid desaturase (delta-12 desaturase)
MNTAPGPSPASASATEPHCGRPAAEAARTSCRAALERYRVPSTPRAVWQLANTLLPYALIWWLLHFPLMRSWWIAPPLIVLAAGLLVRLFIIFHDCGHGSFVRSRLANQLIGIVAGLLTFTPYFYWRWQHGVHHRTSGDLDRRGAGDIWTLTVTEYLEASRWRRFAYRLARNPIILFMVAPLVMFLFVQRVPAAEAPARERRSVYLTNLALVLMIVAMWALFGLKVYLLIQLPLLMISGAAGVWMFYVQHQFDGVYWERREAWDYTAAALQGSSYYKLPRILQWFSGNIGFHHVHHLSPHIPNYNLQRCHNAAAAFGEIRPLTLLASLRSLRLRLWDEPRRELIGYADLRRLRLGAMQLARARARDPQ